MYEGAHVPLASLPAMRERTVTISSTGKTFSLALGHTDAVFFCRLRGPAGC